METKHPGAFTDTLWMSATFCMFKTLTKSQQIWRNAEAGINLPDSGRRASNVVAPVVLRSCLVCHQHKSLIIQSTFLTRANILKGLVSTQNQHALVHASSSAFRHHCWDFNLTTQSLCKQLPDTVTLVLRSR